jgi:hypothetical protein
MTGYENFNRESFNKSSKMLSLTHNVLNPAMLPSGLTQLQYMSICQPMVLASDEIYMLKGWRKSEGAVAELALAKKIKLEVMFEQLTN